MLNLFKRKKKQYYFVYCPACGFELCAGGQWLGQDITDPAIEAYVCNKCNTFSLWNFDTPAPMRIPIGGSNA